MTDYKDITTTMWRNRFTADLVEKLTSAKGNVPLVAIHLAEESYGRIHDVAYFEKEIRNLCYKADIKIEGSFRVDWGQIRDHFGKGHKQREQQEKDDKTSLRFDTGERFWE